MYFDLTDEQEAIRSTARDFLASRFKSERMREIAGSADGTDEQGWKEMAELGWAGLALPEEWGGQGLGIVDLAVLFEEMGYALAPSPLFSNTVVGLALARSASDEQKERWLRPLAEGTARGTQAMVDAGSTGTPGAYPMKDEADGDVVVLNGKKQLVADAAGAAFFLVATADGRRHIVPADAAGVNVTEEISIDTTRRLSTVTFEGVSVPADQTLPGHGAEFGEVFQRGAVALAAESTGVAQRALDMAVSYAKDREQFGRPIGAYQAVSHRCAQMLLETENSRSAVYGAAWAADADPDALPLSASMAKAYASDAGWRVPDASIQVHGGIGFTWEHDLHLLVRRIKVDEAFNGSVAEHRAALLTA